MKNRRAIIDLFLISALGLFVELIFIRWAASELRILAFYKNFALIAAFLGLGLGFAYKRRSSDHQLFERFFFPVLAASVLLVLILGRTALSEIIMLNRANTEEFVWAGTLNIQDPTINVLLDFSFYAFLFLLFLVITVLFIPLGELTARKFVAFRPLPGYTINVLGSLSGILVYTLISFLGWSPAAWYFLTGVAGLYFLISCNKRNLYLQATIAVAPILLTLLWPTGADLTFWSPYYRIDLTAKYAPHEPNTQLGYELSVNQAWHQRLWNLDQGFVAKHYSEAPDHFDTMQSEYDTPYQAAKRLDNVLIVGAGTGNDAAGALRAGAHHITAVEIDPVILRIGQEMHPESPYRDTQVVTLVTQDARSFFRRDRNKYDVIVFGLLDSHTLFSTASSIRLDNFVYTQESLQNVRNMLKKDGLLAISFGVPPANEWVGWRLYRTLTDVFEHPPQVYEFLNHDILFLIGEKQIPARIVDDPRVTNRTDYVYNPAFRPVTDDWPYLYLQSPSLPSAYLIGLMGVILISLLLIWRVVPDFKQFNAHFFFMGAAFFLLETKSLTEMALLFGSTWIVNAVVIAAILFMIVIANLIVERFRITNPFPSYALLAISLLFNFFVPVSSYLGLPLTWRIGLSTTVQVVPLFFAGMVFAVTFSKTHSIENALGSNLIGSVMGGIFEYSSLVFGIRSLYLIALVFYLLSFLVLRHLNSGKQIKLFPSISDKN
jgi:SAM-dependent methyltransferase